MKWSLPAFSLKHPITVTVLVIALVGVGIAAGRLIQVEFIMPVDFPTIRCWIPYAGASPEQVEREVAVPAEGEFRKIRGLKRIYTRSDSGGCYALLSFDWKRNMAAALSETRDQIDRLKLKLPAEVNRFFLRRYRHGPEGLPILSFALFSSTDSQELAHWGRTQLKPPPHPPRRRRRGRSLRRSCGNRLHQLRSTGPQTL